METVSETPAQIRWYVKESRSLGSWPPPQKLQQLWVITIYEDGEPIGTREEWRDVPTEIVPIAKQ